MQTYLPTLNSSLLSIEILSFLLTGFLGVISHFVYEWSGKHSLVGFFFPVNESTWEHLKLTFFPIFIVSLLEYFASSIKNPAFICIKLQSALWGMLVTVVLFYTYSGVLGTFIDWVNIVIYFIAIAVSYFYSYTKLSTGTPVQCNPVLSLLLVSSITILFMVFTIYPPKIGLFRAP